MPERKITWCLRLKDLWSTLPRRSHPASDICLSMRHPRRKCSNYASMAPGTTTLNEMKQCWNQNFSEADSPQAFVSKDSRMVLSLCCKHFNIFQQAYNDAVPTRRTAQLLSDSIQYSDPATSTCSLNKNEATVGYREERVLHQTVRTA